MPTDPSSEAYRARYSGAQGMRNSLSDAIALNDLPAFRAAVAQAIPDTAQRRRAAFLRLQIDPLAIAFDRGALPIVEQLLQWDPAALTEAKPAYLDDALARVLDHWRYAAQEDIDRHEDDEPAAVPDGTIAVAHARLARILLAAGATPRPRGPSTGTSELGDVAQLPASREVIDIAEALLRRDLPVNAEGSEHLTPYAYAARMQNLELIELMTRYQRPSQDSLDQALLVTPVTEANPLLRYLLEKGADVNAQARMEASRNLTRVDLARAAAARFRYYHESGPIRLLIEHKVNPNRTAPGGNDNALTLLLTDPSLALALLDLGADPNWRDGSANTPLHRLTRTALYAPTLPLEPPARARLVAGLLAHGADANAANRDGVTPLAQLSASEEPSIDVLLSAGATLNLRERDVTFQVLDLKTRTRVRVEIGPIVWSLLQRNDYLAAALFARAGRLAPNDCGAVYFAARTGAVKTLAALISGKAETRIVTQDRDMTPLQAAAELGQLLAVRVLLDRRVATVDEATPRQPMAVAEVLEAARYGVLAVATGGETALGFAVKGGYPEVVAELLRRGADPNHRDALGRRILAYARAATVAGREDGATIEHLLLSHGARD